MWSIFQSSASRLGCISKLFESVQMTFLRHLKNLSSTSKYVEISTWALFNAMQKLQINQKSGDLLRMLWKCSEVFFQLKMNQKYIYNVIIWPNLSFVGKCEDWKFYPPYLQIESFTIPGVFFKTWKYGLKSGWKLILWGLFGKRHVKGLNNLCKNHSHF